MTGKIFIAVKNRTDPKLDPQKALSFVTQNCNGAETLFVGTVRQFNQGKHVLSISYDVFTPLAEKFFKEICEESQVQWGKEVSIYIVHAKGNLAVGEISILIAVGSPHRDEAFKACRYIIEQIKKRCPIWKQEHYQNGKSEWAKGCELCTKPHNIAS